MNLFTAPEVVKNYAATGKKKSEMSIWRILLLGVIAGMFIAFSAVVTNTASHSIGDISTVRIICGVLFPTGLVMVILMGAELFTGDCLIVISVLEKQAKLSGMIKCCLFAYTGNLIGSLIVAWGCAFHGQLDYSSGGLAVYTMKVAIGKVSLAPSNAVVLGIFCNVLVCFAVLCSFAAKDAAGRIAGAYLPVLFFVLCGFEHCVANMYYIPAGIMASQVPAYAEKALEAGLDLSVLTWSNFFIKNLLPVTLGNLIGGVSVGASMWFGHIYGKKEYQ